MTDSIIEGFRLSPQQQRLWMLRRDNPGLDYRAQCAILIEGPLDLPVLAQALTDLVERYEILRTGIEFISDSGLPVQVINASCLTLDKCDLRGRDEGEQEREIEEMFARAREV